jgi:chromosomal replication initiation ATPase DnaA
MPVRRIVEQATRIFALGPNEICGPRRPTYVTMARHAVYLIACEAGWSSPCVGRIVNRDHSTVLHGRDVALRDIERNPEYAARVQELREFAVGPTQGEDHPASQAMR